MKIALVHDYIKEYGGAEKVLSVLHEMFPDAPIYTSVYLPEYLGPHKEKFEKANIKTSFLQHIPFKAKLISPFRLLAPFVFKNFDLSSFDTIIVSQTGAYFPNLVRKGNPSTGSGPSAKLICYTHTPPRYLYGYKTAREWKNNKVLLVLGEIANHFLRLVDFKAAQNVDQFIANSEEVKGRIKKFYRKEAIVIYPPAINYASNEEKSSHSVRTINDEYYVTGGRLARAKGIDVIVDAFKDLDLPLKIFGKGFAGYEEELLKKAKSYASNEERSSRPGKAEVRTIKNIEFVGEVSDEEKFELLKNAKAFIFASYDEDFGITPIEAMSVGTPVIAYKSGGVKETIVDPSTGSGRGATGLFYEENTPENLVAAVKKFDKVKFDHKEIIKQAEKFSEETFRDKMLKIIKK